MSVPSSSPTLSLIYDGLDVNVTSSTTWFHINHDMVSCRIYTLSFHKGHSFTLGHPEKSQMQITWQSRDVNKISRTEKGIAVALILNNRK